MPRERNNACAHDEKAGRSAFSARYNSGPPSPRPVRSRTSEANEEKRRTEMSNLPIYEMLAQTFASAGSSSRATA